MKRIPISALAALTVVGLLAACSSGGETPEATFDENEPVTISVQGYPVATDTAAVAAFDARIDAFEKEYPNITVEPSTNVWDGLTFSAQLAGKTIEDVIEVPLTEPQGLIARGQVVPITDQLADWEHYGELNPQALEPLSDEDGEIYGLPRSLFAQGLVYNRALFEAAGLDPDSPPTTWDEVREYADQINEATGKPGFLMQSIENQGGWQLSILTYAFGGDIQTADGDTYVSAFNDEPTADALQMLSDMRWKDASIGSNILNNQNDIIRQFAAGEVGMYMGTPGTYRLAKVNFGMPNTDDFGITSMPQVGDTNATLTGGQVLMVPASVSGAKLAAAAKWLVFAYGEPAHDPELAAENAEVQAADPAAVIGVPSLPIFDAEHQELIDEAIAPFVNVELEHFLAYKEGTAGLELKAEPPLAAQEVYAILDTVVQTVLTDENADIEALLDAAEQAADAKITAASR